MHFVIMMVVGMNSSSSRKLSPTAEHIHNIFKHSKAEHEENICICKKHFKHIKIVFFLLFFTFIWIWMFCVPPPLQLRGDCGGATFQEVNWTLFHRCLRIVLTNTSYNLWAIATKKSKLFRSELDSISQFRSVVKTRSSFFNSKQDSWISFNDAYVVYFGLTGTFQNLRRVQ